MYNRDDIFNLAELVDAVLQENNHTRDEIVCILWGDNSNDWRRAISLDLDSFWDYAEHTDWDDSWTTGPHYPLAMISQKGWWIESTEYDSRTSLRFCEEPKAKAAKIAINNDGQFYDKENEK